MTCVLRDKAQAILFVVIIATYLLILLANYLLGTSSISDAHLNQFRGGMCGACQGCGDAICDSKSGFDIYYLYYSLLIFTFIVGFTNAVLDKKLSSSLLLSTISAISYLVLTEIIIKVLNIPVLYTHFQEGRQSLSTSAFTLFHIGYNIFPLFLSIISSLAGNIIGFPFLVIRKKLSHN